jgi:hypothetical protein
LTVQLFRSGVPHGRTRRPLLPVQVLGNMLNFMFCLLVWTGLGAEGRLSAISFTLKKACVKANRVESLNVARLLFGRDLTSEAASRKVRTCCNQICPAGQQLNYGGRNEGNRTFGYIGTRKKCGPCQQRSQCTTGPFRYLLST